MEQAAQRTRNDARVCSRALHRVRLSRGGLTVGAYSGVEAVYHLGAQVQGRRGLGGWRWGWEQPVQLRFLAISSSPMRASPVAAAMQRLSTAQATFPWCLHAPFGCPGCRGGAPG